MISFFLLVYGAANILIYSSMFEKWRNFLKRFGEGGLSLHKLFTCMMCLPTWLGFLFSYVFIYFNLIPLLPIFIPSCITLSIFFNGLIASGATWLIHTLQEKLER